ncbi:MAG: shikimate dehydrogenase [Bacteroidota bacterium]|nr:shikimate dehydrogenase [Bacteroidota bacterium]MDX5430954.1 shikimate dehydrogenase [Bacteroidota bacterium]MDX5469702.1 shikimate dehydrogenase [Bacteroidota bacterium]
MKLFGLIGKSLGHSFSQSYFRNKFKELQCNDYEYALFELENIGAFSDLVKSTPELRGLNVTIPYKQEILPFLNTLDQAAQEIGAVNTIQFTPSGLKGWNTDVIGFRESLIPMLQTHHDKALVLGDGGASKAVQYVLTELQIPFQLVSRKGSFSFAMLNASLLSEYFLIIQTTPVGMYPESKQVLPIDFEGIGPQHLVYDLIYNPAETEFLRLAKMQGAQTKNGLEMLHLQAEAAWKIWNS